MAEPPGGPAPGLLDRWRQRHAGGGRRRGQDGSNAGAGRSAAPDWLDGLGRLDRLLGRGGAGNGLGRAARQADRAGPIPLSEGREHFRPWFASAALPWFSADQAGRPPDWPA